MAPTRVLLRLLAGAVAKRGKGQIPSFFGNMYAEIVSSANFGAEKAQNNNQEPGLRLPSLSVSFHKHIALTKPSINSGFQRVRACALALSDCFFLLGSPLARVLSLLACWGFFFVLVLLLVLLLAVL